MSDDVNLSRRQWFRLRGKPPAPSRDAAVGEQAVGLTPIETPPNHDGMDLSELPPMREAMLTAEQVRELFGDIGQLASDVVLMQRSTSASRAAGRRIDSAQSLIQALDLLLAGGVSRVQIRYGWNGANWIDTLEAKPEGYRLVRIVHAR